jgi:Phosphotransferase enzyme family
MHDFIKFLSILLHTEAANISLVTNGINKTFLIKQYGSNLYARFSPEFLHDKSEMSFEASILMELESHSLPACRVFAVNETAIHGPLNVDGVSYNLLVTHEVVGSVPEFTVSNAEKFGVSLARIHVVKPLTVVPKTQRLVQLVHSIDDNTKGIIEKLRVFASGSPDPEQICLCHGDSWLGNVKIAKGIIVFFDFEDVHFGNPVFDVATFVWMLLSENRNDSAELYEAFLDGYTSISNFKIDHNELKRNVALKEMQNLIYLCNHITLPEGGMITTLESSRDILCRVNRRETNLFAEI